MSHGGSFSPARPAWLQSEAWRRRAVRALRRLARAQPREARLGSAFETLLLFNENYQLTANGLAESVTQDNPKQYTIKLRQGVEFQNGKTMTADDVIYSIQRIGTKGNGLTGYAATATMDVAGMKKLDKYM